MKLIYIAQIGLLDDWAHTVQIMKMCEAFALNGAEVTLVVPKRNIANKTNPFEYYGIRENFKIIRVPYIDLFQGSTNVLWYWIRSFSFIISARIALFFVQYDAVYTRELYLNPLFRNVYIERHSFPKLVRDIHHFIFRTSFGLVVLTSFIKSKLVEVGIPEEKIFVAPDAVRLEDFSNTYTTIEAREKLKLSGVDKLFGYVGTLKTMGMEKGLSTAIQSLQFLPANYKLYVVGGEEQDIEFYKDFAQKKNVLSRVIFVGKVPHADVPLHISACDVLVAPFPKNEHYSYYMSPLKIFEYMASRRPMVVTDLPSLREVLKDHETALFMHPDNAEELATAIKNLSTDSHLAQKIAGTAYMEVVEKYTWKKRAENILKFIGTKNI